MKPVKDCVLFVMDLPEVVSSSGLILHNHITVEKVRLDTGTVIDVGKSVTQVNAGDRIKIQKGFDVPFEKEGKIYSVIKEKDILFVYD